jgi:glycerol kinase
MLKWGIESAMLAAGTNVEWLRDGLGLVATSSETHDIASTCTDTGGVVYVPALMGLGTPRWDYGARSGFFGLTRGTTRAQMVRAVLEGVAQRGVDLVEAAETAGATTITALRIDGGMSDNPTFVQALADAAQRPVEVAPVREATARGAGLFGLLAIGAFHSVGDLAATWTPRVVVTPERVLDRTRWRDAVERVTRWIPELSGVEF